ncbi:hypothetical protein CDD80_3098 [Ophiocordyceps camponoti-rufipedis]|uniref:Dehydrogenase FUB6 n=1 Tax=Ophiocordyceps camponoti-rufipedis TaxID=2004952 RepID=A0A2C5Z3G2_9HYPO|nr:hypothetical protein CDD80_3098 [Ophiocordyceps camponoti-rufipedis]
MDLPKMNLSVILAERPHGHAVPGKTLEFRQHPTASEEDLKESHIFVETLYLSLDPAMRLWMNGDIITAETGWTQHAILPEGKFTPASHFNGVTDPQLLLSVLGMTGITAWVGITRIGDPQPGELVVVSAASGATGSIAGQIAKIRGARVVGVCGGEEKCRWLTDELGFDDAVDYKAADFEARFREATKPGIDVYFDNVGGETLEMCLDRANRHARFVECGQISQYNSLDPRGPRNFFNVIGLRIRIQGFIVSDYKDEYPQAIKELAGWVSEGRLKQATTVVPASRPISSHLYLAHRILFSNITDEALEDELLSTMAMHCQAAIAGPAIVCLLSAAHLASRIVSRARRARHHQDEPRAASARAPLALTSIEAIALAVDVLVAVASLAQGSRHHQAQLLAAILSSAYALCLLCAAAAALSTISPVLRRHLMAIYSIQWLVTLLAAHHHLLARTPHSMVPLMRLPVFTLLLLLRACASRPHHHEAVASETASFASRMSLSWMTDLLCKAYRNALDVNHLQHVAQCPKLARLASSFCQTTSATQPLVKRLFSFLARETMTQASWALLASATLFIPVWLLHGILIHMESDPVRSRGAWQLIVGLLVCGLVNRIANAQRDWAGHKMSVKLRGILTSQKTGEAVALPKPTAQDDAIVDIVDVDAAVVAEIGSRLHIVWLTVPVHVVIVGCVLYAIVGFNSVAGLVSIIALLPLRSYLSQRHVVARHRAVRSAAVRGNLAIDMLSNVRTIKLNAWETGFENRMDSTRQMELDRLRGKLAWWSAYTTACCATPFLAVVVVFFCHTIVAGRALNSSVAFPVMVAFALLRSSLDRAADMMSFVPQAATSIARIENFLEEWEKDSQPRSTRDDSIGFDGATLEWPDPACAHDEQVPLVNLEHRPPFKLHGLQIRFVPQGLNVLFGPKGSGKSSILLALLGEMDLIDGRLHLPQASSFEEPSRATDNPFSLCSTVAYCPSPPWIQNKTIRDNVTFGLPFDYERYKAALDAVNLLPQLPTLLRGDLTEVGDNGEHLSVDHRWRVGLARALYSRARFLLVDDCLGGLDVTAAEDLVLRAFRGPLMEGRTSVLAVQRYQPLMALCDHAVCLASGRVRFQGHPFQLVTASQLPHNVLVRAASLARPKRPDDNEIEFVFKNFSKAPTWHERIIEARRTPPEQESASWSAVRLYLESVGNPRFRCLLFCVFVVQQLAWLAPSLWIEHWTAHGEWTYQMALFAAAVVASIVTLFVRDATVSRGTIEACKALHRRLMAAILLAKFNFLDRHPASYTTLRYAKDAQFLDRDVGPLCSSIVHAILGLVVSLCVVSAMAPAFLLVAIPAGLVCAAAGSLFVSLSNHLKQLSTPRRSALLQHVRETISGSVSIRAYGQAAAFVNQTCDLVDQDIQIQLLLKAAQEWLVFRIACVGVAVSSVTGALMLWSSAGASATGLGLTLAMSLDEHVLDLIHALSQSRECFDAVARIKQLIEAEREPAEPLRELREPWYAWPQRGSIRFRDFSTQYAPDERCVLKKIDVNIQGGRRVAVVGEKGSGKTSLAMSMVRRLEAADGLIELDGVNMASLRLDVLRQLVTLVPQDPNPALFSGTLRRTLDPLLSHSDEDLRRVMEGLRLSCFIPTGLDEPMRRLSVSQRQLICVARALLQRSLVIIIDEATDAMDEEADQAVQTALRDGIAAGTTVVTMTQRLRSIADYDDIIVLAGGSVVEHGIPERLLDKDVKSDRGAFFKLMCQATGEFRLIEKRAGLRTLLVLSLYEPPRGIWTGERGNRILETHNWSRYNYDLSGVL